MTSIPFEATLMRNILMQDLKRKLIVFEQDAQNVIFSNFNIKKNLKLLKIATGKNQ